MRTASTVAVIVGIDRRRPGGAGARRRGGAAGSVTRRTPSSPSARSRGPGRRYGPRRASARRRCGPSAMGQKVATRCIHRAIKPTTRRPTKRATSAAGGCSAWRSGSSPCSSSRRSPWWCSPRSSRSVKRSHSGRRARGGRRDRAHQRRAVAADDAPRAAADDRHLRARLAGAERRGVALAFYWSTAGRPRSAADVADRASPSRSCRCSSRRCSTSTATPTTCSSSAAACGARAGEPQRRPGRDPVRDRRPRRGRPAGGAPRRARADDRALARDRYASTARLGVRPLLADRREPGRAAAREQLGHAGVSLVSRRSRAARWSPTTPPTPPRSSVGARAARACSRARARAGATCSPATRPAARRR